MLDWRLAIRHAAITHIISGMLVVVFASPVMAQTPTDPMSAQLRDLTALVQAMRAELATSREATVELQRQLETLRAELDALKKSSSISAVGTLAQDHELLAAKVDDQEQTKVESGSKYRARLSGMMLLNVASNAGIVDNIDLPAVATAPAPGESGGAFAMGVRQSFLSLAVFGPTVGGAKTSGTISFDFSGGFPGANDCLTSGHGRMRTATFAFDWANASIVGAQDVPFFSPETPTSMASVAYPGFASAGNIWSWTPQVHVERRVSFGETSHLVMQAGVLDPLTGELPASEYLRQPTAGERSRRPAEAARVAWQYTGDRAASVGAGVYHAAQNWGFVRHRSIVALTSGSRP